MPPLAADVPDYQGRGESEPSPFFYQNLGEAEYVVALYQYLRLAGYPANKIAILTTYNGQRKLLEDIVRESCEYHPAFGRPSQVRPIPLCSFFSSLHTMMGCTFQILGGS